MRKFLLVAMIVFLSIGSTIFMACGKDKLVNITIINANIAEFAFDKEEYEVGDTATFTVTIDDKYSQSSFTVYANDELLVKDGDGKYSYALNSESVSFEVKDYALNTYTNWMFGWARRGWIKSDNRTPENLNIIKEYYDLINQGYKINLQKVKAHAGHIPNELADKIAKGEIESHITI